MSVVGGILVSTRAFNAVSDLVEPGDFYHPTIAAIYQAMVDLDTAGKPIDQLTIVEQMRASDTFGRLRAFNGEAYFAELMTRVATVDNLPYHARIVRGKATARRLIEVGQEIASHGYGDYGEIDEYLDNSERLIFEVAQRTQRMSYEPVKRVLRTTIKNVETRHHRKQAVTGVPSGFHKLDAMTAGFQPAELVIIAGRPSMGKTALAMNIAENAALEHRFPVLVFSLEMSKEALVERLLCSDAKVESTRLRSGFLEQRDWVNITKSAARIAEAPLWIDDSGAPTLLEIRAKCRRWRTDPSIFKNEGQYGLVVIDYLQLVQGRPSERELNREREISEISRGLKALAKELRCPVVALSQLNRSVESRNDKRPQLSDLRESGAIEQDADVIAFVYRDEVYDKQSEDKGTAEIIIGKQRNGPTGLARLAFLNQFTRFENLAEGRETAPVFDYTR